MDASQSVKTAKELHNPKLHEIINAGPIRRETMSTDLTAQRAIKDQYDDFSVSVDARVASKVLINEGIRLRYGKVSA